MPPKISYGAIRLSYVQGTRDVGVDLLDEGFLQVGDPDDVDHGDKEPGHEGGNEADLLMDIKAHGGYHGEWEDKEGNVGEDIDGSRAKVEGDDVDACCRLVIECTRDGTAPEDTEEGEDDSIEDDDQSDHEGGEAKEWPSLRHAVIEHEN